ncbi:ImmA/IrrE family metallo-endopeptidase [Microbacterium maritypicum]|uniref:ImmA/IrrE family metallo-endopeptidase n=1 Tax=Microbacterium TaxID=33882 RepID=UPI001421B7F3|nr:MULTISPECIES: ImmA/IrrE family metallo-endopeptidase [Microbacterium]
MRNATRMLERLGIGVVVDLDDEAQSHDRADDSGISMPTKNNERPLVATTSIAHGDVQRMTLAHELGHLVLHRDAPSINCSIRHPQEQEAYFLGALVLALRQVMAARISESATLRHFLGVKSEFGVSVGAAVVHAHRLSLISTDRYRGLQMQMQMQMQARKWKYDEPGEVAAESPKPSPKHFRAPIRRRLAHAPHMSSASDHLVCIAGLTVLRVMRMPSNQLDRRRM